MKCSVRVEYEEKMKISYTSGSGIVYFINFVLMLHVARLLWCTAAIVWL